MCSITGAVPIHPRAQIHVGEYLEVFTKALERGRDAWGVATPIEALRCDGAFDYTAHSRAVAEMLGRSRRSWVIGINRGAPTMESAPVTLDDLAPHAVLDENGVQTGRWTTVHNGIIANDHELVDDLCVLPEHGIDSRVLPYLFALTDPLRVNDIAEVLRTHIKGSYAIAAGHEEGTLVLACNYKPIFTAVVEGVLYFSSLPHHLPGYNTLTSTVQKMEPYSVLRLAHGVAHIASLREQTGYTHPTLVVLSGGMDSTTVLTQLVRAGVPTAALHVDYGCHATDRENTAVQRICDVLNVPLITMKTDLFTEIGGSTLTQRGAAVTDGLFAAEYGTEWVPARNLVLSSLAVAIAETRGFQRIALGTNLEESGTHPDNEQEFIRGLNTVMPNAVQEGRRVEFIEPVGNLMKHEIVKLALEVDAPLDLTWSCYRGGEFQCGRCGSCLMRRSAFEMNGVADPVPYDDTARAAS